MKPAKTDLHSQYQVLQNSWQHLCELLNIKHDSLIAQTTYQDLLNHYNQPQRTYHNLQHLTECLVHLYNYPLPVANFGQIEVALWFHDAIYDVHSSCNEQDSAQWAVQFLTSCQVDQTISISVYELIMATQNHSVQNETAQLMIDIDLMILASPKARFAEYQQQIRIEYDFVPDELFRQKRQEVLEGFYQRKRIYQTDYFYQNFEQQARYNLCSVIDQQAD